MMESSVIELRYGYARDVFIQADWKRCFRREPTLFQRGEMWDAPGAVPAKNPPWEQEKTLPNCRSDRKSWALVKSSHKNFNNMRREIRSAPLGFPTALSGL
jgi:hypothetical protein